ncbi:FHA domain-containing protein [Agromyces terreus]|uniref:FHA domain-containing protein n=1 Tax=Agromyces terreus TaxID=424795 RepID=UPI0031DAEB63
MASARCVYCDATLQPNSMYCVECGQLIPQQAARPPVPTQFAAPQRTAPAAAPAPVPGATAGAVTPVPLPRSLPWQQGGSRADAAEQATPAAAAPPKVERIELAFSTGQRIVVSGSAVIGRKPADTALAMGVRAVEVQDDTRSVSRVHLFLDLADGRIHVGDAGSANGARLERGGRIQQLESAGTRVEASVGDTVWLGDLSFEIRPA